MPTINRPRTAAERLQALEAAKAKADVTAPADLAITAATLAWLTTFLPLFRTELQQVGSALSAQSAATNVVEAAQPRMKIFISHFFQVFNLGITRGVYTADQRAHYMLNVNQVDLPRLRTEQEIATWGGRIVTGDAARVAAGGAAMANPSAAQVGAEHTLFVAAQGDQSTKKDAYDNEQEDVLEMNEECDDLIDDIWDECEFTFRKNTPPSKRRKCREYGVVYVPNPGEAPSPEDFSIIGTVTHSVTGLPVSGAAVITTSPEIIVLTDTQGKYYVPVLAAGTYNMNVHKDGYTDQDLPSVVVTAGAITTVNFQLVAAPALTSVVLEANLGSLNIAELITSGFTFTPSSTVQVEISGNECVLSASDVPGPVLGPNSWHNYPGNPQTKTIDAFNTLVGASPTHNRIKIQCVGPLPAHYKITFNNVIEL